MNEIYLLRDIITFRSLIVGEGGSLTGERGALIEGGGIFLEPQNFFAVNVNKIIKPQKMVNTISLLFNFKSLEMSLKNKKTLKFPLLLETGQYISKPT